MEEGLYAHDDTVTAVTVGDKTYRVRRVDDEIRNEMHIDRFCDDSDVPLQAVRIVTFFHEG